MLFGCPNGDTFEPLDICVVEDVACPKGGGAGALKGICAAEVVDDELKPPELPNGVPPLATEVEGAPKGCGIILVLLPPEVYGPEEACCWPPPNGLEEGVGIGEEPACVVDVVLCPKLLDAGALEAPEL